MKVDAPFLLNPMHVQLSHTLATSVARGTIRLTLPLSSTKILMRVSKP